MDNVLDALKEMAPRVAAEESGCTKYFANRSSETDNLILLYEEYADMSAVEAHRETPHYKEIIQRRIVPKLDKREVEFFEPVIG